MGGGGGVRRFSGQLAIFVRHREDLVRGGGVGPCSWVGGGVRG